MRTPRRRDSSVKLQPLRIDYPEERGRSRTERVGGNVVVAVALIEPNLVAAGDLVERSESRPRMNVYYDGVVPRAATAKQELILWPER